MNWSPFQQLDDPIEFVHLDFGETLLQVFDPPLGLNIRPIVLVRLMAVALGLAVLADHDERRRIGRLKRQR